MYPVIGNGLIRAGVFPQEESVQEEHQGRLNDLIMNSTQFMYQVDDQHGWSLTELVFGPPIAGPPLEDFSVVWKGRRFPMDQHGISRILPFRMKERTPSNISVEQNYDGMPLDNPKAGDGKPNPQSVQWFPYHLEKNHYIKQDTLETTITLTNTAEESVPYNLGWHPAFRRIGQPEFRAGNKTFTFDDIAEASQDPQEEALIMSNTNSITWYDRNNGRGMQLTTSLPHLMAWTPSPHASMFCIEPVLHLPSKKPYFLAEEKGNQYSVLDPDDQASVTISLRPFTDP